jgi:hypothetical protein
MRAKTFFSLLESSKLMTRGKKENETKKKDKKRKEIKI